MEEDVRMGGCGRLLLVLSSQLHIQGFRSLDVALACECCSTVSCHLFFCVNSTVITVVVECFFV